ncbi:hypothetical protein BDV40DRAFT_277972 [Aspergillus tamarii]|uniref:Uncharacterized protein n=1 Tax=Aspergillus tamarii TaxID=41984 RepID=A0A5N6UGH9_ASPTM|nr:hypothetical protein BDV40DRAFT_277972 [Aspergillus tamarii]
MSLIAAWHVTQEMESRPTTRVWWRTPFRYNLFISLITMTSINSWMSAALRLSLLVIMFSQCSPDWAGS